jgi:hypothetical protein
MTVSPELEPSLPLTVCWIRYTIPLTSPLPYLSQPYTDEVEAIGKHSYLQIVDRVQRRGDDIGCLSGWLTTRKRTVYFYSDELCEIFVYFEEGGECYIQFQKDMSRVEKLDYIFLLYLESVMILLVLALSLASKCHSNPASLCISTLIALTSSHSSSSIFKINVISVHR